MKKFKLVLATSAVLLGSIGVLATSNFTKGNEMHPNHTGDMPPLLASDGTAFLAFYTNRFYPEDVIGRTVVIHAMRDDFMSQPSGNPGEEIACGEIEAED